MGCTYSNSAKNAQADTEQVPSLKEQRKLDLQKKAFEQHEVFWVCHRDTLSTLKSLVKFEEAQKRNLLVQLRPGQKALFLSHRWLRDSHPDNLKKQKYAAIVFLLNDDCWLDAGVEFFWLDYMCISQDDLERQTKAVNSLPFYIKGCQYFITLYGDEQIGDRSLMEVYDGRGWCRLERFVALATMSVQTYIFNMKTHDLKQTTIEFFQISNLNPICGVFRDGGLPGEQEKMRIAPMLSHLCNFASQYGGVAAIRVLAKEIQDSIVDLGKLVQSKLQKDMDKCRNQRKEETVCIVCMDNVRNVLLLPCKHMCLCRECFRKTNVAICPICRGAVVTGIEVFF